MTETGLGNGIGMGTETGFDKLIVLIVDDQIFVRTILTTMLNQLGITQVLEANDGQSALKVLGQQRPDLMICDLQMRPMDGFTLLRNMRNHNDLRAIPVIFLTAHGEPFVEAKARDLGIHSFLTKPVLPAALHAAIKAAI